jgi:protein arginine kinase activator
MIQPSRPPAAPPVPPNGSLPESVIVMKCQQCEKQAVFHITELETGAVREVHLCEDHARAYLNQTEAAGTAEAAEAGGGPLGVGQTAEDLAALDQKACDMCGITFFEFRNQGRLGCPHDYVHFAKELEPLIANIHGSTEHTGRRPSRRPQEEAGGAAAAEGTGELTRVIGLRREMKDAIACEDYEKAKENRDAIRAIEDRWIAPAHKD